MRPRFSARAAVPAALVFLALGARAAGPGYRKIKDVVLGGEGGWDYLAVDAQARRLYLTRGTKVQALDADTLKPAGEIAGVEGAHGVAFAPELGRGFASAGRADSVVIFDLKTLRALGTVKTGQNPDAILYEPATKRVFAFDGKSKDAAVIDAASGRVVKTIPIGGKPEFAVADGKGTVYVNVEDTGELLVLDARALVVKARWPLAPCAEPTGLTLDAARGVLFAVCSNQKMAVVDAATGKVVATPAIGGRPDAAAFDPETGLAFSSNGDGTLTIVARGKDGAYSVAQTLETRQGARTMALDPKTHRVFLVTADLGPAPKATPEQPRPRPSVVPGTFAVLVFGR